MCASRATGARCVTSGEALAGAMEPILVEVEPWQILATEDADA